MKIVSKKNTMNSLEKYSEIKKNQNTIPSFKIKNLRKEKIIYKNLNVEIYKVLKLNEPGKNKNFLLKIRHKEEIIKSKTLINSILNERKILEILNVMNCEFVVPLRFISHSKKYIFYLFDYIPGGDLNDNLDIIKKNKKIGIYLIAEILLQIEYLHKHGIVHRDIKLENFMCDKFGHALMIDFDLASLQLYNMNDYFGTKGYMAPEISSNKLYNKEVDFYSFGVLSFALLSGKTIRNIEKKLQKINPIHADFIKKLTCVDPTKRLGYNNFDEIKNHEIFKNINWVLFPNKNDRLFTPIGCQSAKNYEIDKQSWFKGISYTHPDFLK